MGRSQRHQLEQQNTTSAGELHAEGMIAPSIVRQNDVTTPAMNELTVSPKATEQGGWIIPDGAAGGPLQGSTMSGAVPEGAPPGPNAGPPDPAPGEEPVLNSINPSSARIGSADVVMNVTGNRFTDTSVIYFNGGPEPTEFVDEGKITTIVKPSTATVEGSFPVWVQQGSYQTTEKTFTFLPESTGERTLPAGPFDIARVEDHAEGLSATLSDASQVQVGDTVTIEATGNTSVNGAYEVLSIDGNVVVFDNPFVLTAPIEAKGRLTVT